MKKYLLLLSIMFGIFTFAQQKDVFEIARSGTVQEMELLIKQNPDVINSVNNSGFSVLILACYRGNKEVAEFLITHVKNIEYNSPMGTALMSVVYKGDLNIAQKLLKQGADVNNADSQGTTPLIFASKLGNVDMVKLFLQNNANKSIVDKEGRTAFEYAVFSKNQQLINQLKN